MMYVALSMSSSWETVQLSRHPSRPYTLDYIEHGTTEFVELHGDRLFAEDSSLVGGFATLNSGRKILILGHQKGRTTRDKVARNFGMSKPEGYRKAIRLMELAERWKLPVVTLIDTPGAYPGIDAESRGQAEAIAQALMVSSRIAVPFVACVIGEGGSGGALALGLADRVLMQERSTYSVISPEACASILWSDSSQAERAAGSLKLSAAEVAKLPGIIDGIVPEPTDGAHTSPKEAAKLLWETIERHLEELCHYTADQIVENRGKKLRQLGNFSIQ